MAGTEQKIKNTPEKVKKGFGPRSAILVTLAIYFGAQIIAGVLLGSYLYLLGKDSQAIESILNESTLVQFSFIFIVEVLSLWFLWLFLKKRKINFAEIGIKKPTLNNLMYALPAYGIYFIILITLFAVIAGFTTGVDFDQEQQIGFEGASGVVPLALVFAALVIFPAVVEEVLIRGFLYSGLIRKYSKKISAILASSIFAIAHLQLGSGEPPLWVAGMDTFVLSVVLIYLRELTGNIWAGVAVHLIKNSLAFISLFIIKIV